MDDSTTFINESSIHPVILDFDELSGLIFFSSCTNQSLSPIFTHQAMISFISVIPRYLQYQNSPGILLNLLTNQHPEFSKLNSLSLNIVLNFLQTQISTCSLLLHDFKETQEVDEPLPEEVEEIDDDDDFPPEVSPVKGFTTKTKGDITNIPFNLPFHISPLVTPSFSELMERYLHQRISNARHSSLLRQGPKHIHGSSSSLVTKAGVLFPFPFQLHPTPSSLSISSLFGFISILDFLVHGWLHKDETAIQILSSAFDKEIDSIIKKLNIDWSSRLLNLEDVLLDSNVDNIIVYFLSTLKLTDDQITILINVISDFVDNPKLIVDLKSFLASPPESHLQVSEISHKNPTRRKRPRE